MANDLATQNAQLNTILQYLNNRKEQLSAVVAHTLTPERLIKVAIAAISRSPKLLQCSPETLYSCIHTSAQLGLEVGGPLRHAHLVPFNNNKTGGVDCTLIVGYEGLLELIRRTGEVATVYAEAARKGDDFQYVLGLHRDLKHERKASFDPSGKNVIAAYAVAHLKSGQFQFAVMMRDEIDCIRSRAKAKDGPAWSENFEEMAKKTVIRRLSKYIPKSTELADALSHEEDESAGDLKMVEGIVAAGGERQLEDKATKEIAIDNIVAGAQSQPPSSEAPKATRKKKSEGASNVTNPVAAPALDEKKPEPKAAPKEEPKPAPVAQEEPGSNDGPEPLEESTEQQLDDVLDAEEEKPAPQEAAKPKVETIVVTADGLKGADVMIDGVKTERFRIIISGKEDEKARSYYTRSMDIVKQVRGTVKKDKDGNVIERQKFSMSFQTVDGEKQILGVKL